MTPQEPDTPFWVTTLFDRLDTMGNQINARLDKINGTVRRHDSEIEVLRTQSHLPESCRMVADLEQRVASIETRDTADALVRGRVWKIAAAGGAVMAAVTELGLAFFRR